MFVRKYVYVYITLRVSVVVHGDDYHIFYCCYDSTFALLLFGENRV
jgi:hypothetical protein